MTCVRRRVYDEMCTMTVTMITVTVTVLTAFVHVMGSRIGSDVVNYCSRLVYFRFCFCPNHFPKIDHDLEFGCCTEC